MYQQNNFTITFGLYDKADDEEKNMTSDIRVCSRRITHRDFDRTWLKLKKS